MASDYAPVVRRAVPGDATAILVLVEALADYEKLPRPLPDARERLVRDLFGPDPRLDCQPRWAPRWRWRSGPGWSLAEAWWAVGRRWQAGSVRSLLG